MKKVILGMGVMATIGLGYYSLMNKQTKKNADKLLNNLLDKANDVIE